jgi:hypothetical protein
MEKTWHVNSRAAANGRVVGGFPPPPPYCLEVVSCAQKNNNHYITKPAGAGVFLSVSAAPAFSPDAVFARRSVKPPAIAAEKKSISFFHIFLATMFLFGFIRPRGGRFSGMAWLYLYTFKFFGASIQRVEEVL